MFIVTDLVSLKVYREKSCGQMFKVICLSQNALNDFRRICSKESKGIS